MGPSCQMAAEQETECKINPVAAATPGRHSFQTPSPCLKLVCVHLQQRATTPTGRRSFHQELLKFGLARKVPWPRSVTYVLRLK